MHLANAFVNKILLSINAFLMNAVLIQYALHLVKRCVFTLSKTVGPPSVERMQNKNKLK